LLVRLVACRRVRVIASTRGRSGIFPPNRRQLLSGCGWHAWRCGNDQCDRQIFAERFPGLAAPFARQTERMAGIVRLFGIARVGDHLSDWWLDWACG
jgi:hypothetical protein